MNLKEENIENLTRLWKTAGSIFKGYEENEDYALSLIKESQWPNKIWLNQPNSERTMEALTMKMYKHPELTFSNFYSEIDSETLLKQMNLTLQFQQYGMSLPLTSQFNTSKELKFKKVESVGEAKSWSSAFESAFGYLWNPETITQTVNTIPYYLIYHNEELVGTVLLYFTGKTAGIHALGILPEQRKKGFATEIMYWTLNQAMEQGATIATLQASEMAKNMYSKMGFTQDFMMNNYKLKTY